jgi:hypothetical protein
VIDGRREPNLSAARNDPEATIEAPIATGLVSRRVRVGRYVDPHAADRDESAIKRACLAFMADRKQRKHNSWDLSALTMPQYLNRAGR